jgi:hypothetical protein
VGTQPHLSAQHRPHQADLQHQLFDRSGVLPDWRHTGDPTPLQNPDQQVSRWIVTKTLFTQVADASPPHIELAQVRAPTENTDAARVLDIRKQGSNVVRRIQRADNTCVDESIDAFTGRRLEQKPAPCSKF